MRAGGVFISSTCHDLIDIRAELEALVLEMGLRPVLSDSALSDFDLTPPQQSSIELCLTNVRECPVFVCILSSRYGPVLPGRTISATELEYEEARKNGKTILLYVRDQLSAEADFWRRGGSPHAVDSKLYPWSRGDTRLLGFLLELQKLRSDTDPNWRTLFRNSVELKEQVERQLQGLSRRHRLRSALATGDVPVIVATATKVAGNSGLGYELSLQNLGRIPALNVSVRVVQKTPAAWTSQWQNFGHMGFNQTQAANLAGVSFPMRNAEVEVKHATPGGLVVVDRFELGEADRASLRLKRREPMPEESGFEVG